MLNPPATIDARSKIIQPPMQNETSLINTHGVTVSLEVESIAIIPETPVVT